MFLQHRGARADGINQPQGKIKHAPNRGYHFVSLSPPFSLRRISPFPAPENLPFSAESPPISTGSPVQINCFPHQEIGSKYDAKVKPVQSQNWALCELLSQTQTVHSPKKCQGIHLGNDGVNIAPKDSLAINSQRITPKSLQAHASLG